MKYRILMIGQDGSKIHTRQETEIYSGNDKHDKLFMDDIFPTRWFQQQNIPYHPQRPFHAQLPELTTTGNIIMLDTSYQDRVGNIHSDLQIVAPPIDKITLAQKAVLKDYYQELTEEPLDQTIIDCVIDSKNYEIESFSDLNSFYEALSKKENEFRRQR